MPAVFPKDQMPAPILPDQPHWCDLYWKACEIAWRNIEQPPLKGWKPQMTCMPGVGNIWQWDSCFMAMFCKYASQVLPGMNNLDNLYSRQDADGYISMAYRMATGKPAYGKFINPPLYAWVEWDYYRATGDRTRFPKVLPVLTAYFDWLKVHRRRENGLYWFEIPGASGMDNAPRGGSIRNGSGMGHVDISAQQALAARCLAAMAAALGQSRRAQRFDAEFRDLKEKINAVLWHAKTGFYYDVFDDVYRHKNFVNHKTVAGFWPMLAGVATHDQVDRLVEHLLNPQEFWRPHPVPSLSADDPNYDSLGAYWRGGVWPPTNYMIARGLQYYERWDILRELAVRHVEALSEVERNFSPRSLWEVYSPDQPRPATCKVGEISRDNFVGWTGLGPIAMLIEHILGLDLNVPAGRIDWHIQTCEEQGIRRLPFGKGRVDLLCRKRAGRYACPEITASATVPVTLCVISRDRRFEMKIKPGR